MPVYINEDYHTGEIKSVAQWLAEHEGHVITSTGPVPCGACVVNVRLCADCGLFHVAHNDERDRPEPRP